MRLLSVFFTAAIATLLVAVVGTPAAAQSTGQTLQTREKTGAESTTRTPAPDEQSARDAQANAACPGAVPVGSVGPTEDDLEIGPFTVTGDNFRLTYETTDADESGLPLFDVTVLDQAGKEVGGRVIFEEGVQQEIVRASPGRFKIEAIADDLTYKLTIEDCMGNGNPSGGSGGGGGSASDDQYGNNGGPPDEDVIDDTISDEPLPNTGGVPLLGLAAFGLMFTFAAFALLRPVIRRDS
jgi:hypothetical protein